MSTRVVIFGTAGRMGRMLVALAKQEPAFEIAAAVEAPGHPALGSDAGEISGCGTLGIPVTAAYEDLLGPDVVGIDFTRPEATLEHMRVAARAGAAMVVGTTGFAEAQEEELDRLARTIRSVVAPNMSIGVNVLLGLVRRAATALGGTFDPEIVEMHHRKKVDAPSGTALALAREIAGALGRDLGRHARYGRHGIVGERTGDEIGILALRGGDVVGDHTVIFAGAAERLELTHRAQSREAFARGALRAAAWVRDRAPGRYGMADVLGLG